MKSASPALVELLQSGQFIMADLYTFLLKSGTVARYTGADMSLTVGGNVFTAMGPRIERGRTKVSRGIEVDTLDVTVYPSATDTLSGVPFLHAVRTGALDNARLLLERCFMPAWGDTSAGTIVLFSGRLGDQSGSRSAVKLEVRSFTDLLNQMVPAETYQPSCLNSLFDSDCGLNKAAFSVAGTVLAGSTQLILNCGVTSYPPGWFALGTVSFSSGPNAGVVRSVKTFAPGVVGLSIPLEVAPTVGDSFLLRPGCDRRQTTCGNSIVRSFSVNPATDTLGSAGHGYADNDRVVTSVSAGGSAPGGLPVGVTYYIREATTDTFKLSLAYGGDPINITSAGTGTQRIRAIGKFDNLVRFRAHPYVPIPETAV